MAIPFVKGPMHARLKTVLAIASLLAVPIGASAPLSSPNTASNLGNTFEANASPAVPAEFLR